MISPFNLLFSPRKPTSFSPFDLTRLTITASFSRPWNPSTLPSSMPGNASFIDRDINASYDEVSISSRLFLVLHNSCRVFETLAKAAEVHSTFNRLVKQESWSVQEIRQAQQAPDKISTPRHLVEQDDLGLKPVQTIKTTKWHLRHMDPGNFVGLQTSARKFNRTKSSNLGVVSNV